VSFALNICGDYAAENEIAFNCKKTFGLLFWPKNYEQPASSNAFRNGVQIRFFDQAKYLGVLVNDSLKHDDDMQRQVKSLYCAINKFRGSGVTDRGASCLLGRLNAKIGPLFSLFLY